MPAQTFVPAHHVLSASEQPRARAFVLHGALGSRRNWQGFARRLARSHPAWAWVLIDLRHHGESKNAPFPTGLQAAADDLTRLAERIGAPQAVFGHSLGGRVALAYAARAVQVEHLWVIDTDPGRLGEDSDSDAARLLSLLGSADPTEGPAALTPVLQAQGFSERVTRWVQSNFRSDGQGGWHLGLDVDGVRSLLADARDTDLWPTLEQLARTKRTHVVTAGQNRGWSEQALERLGSLAATGGLHWHVLPQAGHWVHVDDPMGLETLVREHLPD